MTDFIWGVATASYQVEGATTEDGRGASIWDTFAATPGNVVDGSDGSVACDSYHRLDEDLALIEGLGVSHYRFSIAWPRIQPTGSGPALQKGFDYYERLVDGLLVRGISPMATLYHWDLPQALQDGGGWLSRDTALRFADYATLVHERLGDRVGTWATHNEPWCAAYLGHGSGRHAPGRRDGGDAHRATHHLLLGHGLAAARLREAGAGRQAVPDGMGVGIVLNLTPVWPDRPEAAEVADGVDAIRNRIWLGPLVDGAYDDGTRAVAPVLDDPALVQEGDLALVKGSADWLGVNYYTPARVDVGEAAAGEVAGGDAGVEEFPGVSGFRFTPRPPLTDIGWEVEPRGLEELLVDTHRRTGLPLVVTENGAAYPDDQRAADGSVDDQDRIGYLRDHVAATLRARDQGADVRGYVLWTLMDNFEWAEGYTKRFGIVHVDRDTLARTPKASYGWYADLVREQRA